MKCECGFENENNAKFCEKCGKSLKKGNVKSFALKNINLLKDVFVNPIKASEDLNNKDYKNIGIFSGIVALICALLKFLSFMFGKVHTYKYYGLSSEKVWRWDYLKFGDSIVTILSTIANLALFIALVAFVYYVASLMLKKETSFKKLLTSAIVGVIPAFVCTYFLSIFSNLFLASTFTNITEILALISIIYSIAYTIFMINKAIDIKDDNKKVLMNVIAISVICLIIIFVFEQLFASATLDIL